MIPDASFKNETSIVIPNQVVDGIPSEKISGGATRGSNLFHSFQEFNINTGRGIYFDNPQGIQSILTRVTGNNSSNIYGVLGVLGEADLFLLNPNGVIFGPNARLDLNSSFLATSADYIKFEDGQSFSARSREAVPMLTISTPVGLGFTGSAGPIEVQGPGHVNQIPQQLLPSTPLDSNSAGLKVRPDNTIALIGGEVIFRGGIVTSPSGSIEIGSVISGEVGISKNSDSGISLKPQGIKSRGNILFSQLALLDASGFRNGNIRIFGENVTFTDSSMALIQNLGSSPLGEINIDSQNSLTILGDTKFTSKSTQLILPERGIITHTFADGRGANISISTKVLNVDFAGRIIARSVGSGSSGDLTIFASESTTISGNSPFNPSFPLGSTVATAAAGTGSSGHIALFSPQLSIKDGGQLTSSVFRNSDGGDIVINSEMIDLSGFNLISLSPSIISSLTSGNGKGGDLLINSVKLNLKNGGRVDASTLASGPAGNITINSKDSISVSGIIPGSVNPSLIISSANIVDPSIQAGLELPPIPTGESGSITIRTGRLEVFDGAEVTVKNDGPNNAGQLTIFAKNIRVSDGGTLSGSTKGGDGGNVLLFVDILLLEDGSISTSALNQGKGGNISAVANFVIALKNSNITAEAEQGQGGNITIAAKAVFLGPDVDVSVSSDAGLQASGTFRVVVEQQDFNETSAPAPDVITTPKVSSVCNPSGKVSEFVVLGTGGLKEDPQSGQSKGLKWNMETSDLATVPSETELPKAPLVEAKGWQKLDDRRVMLTANPQNSSNKVAAHPTPCNQSS